VVVKKVPMVESVSILAPNGRCICHSAVRCRVVLEAGLKPLFQWFRGDGEDTWEKIPRATDADFVPEEDDIGFFLACEVVPVNSAGWKGHAATGLAASPVEPVVEAFMILPAESVTGTELETNAGKSVSWEREEESGEWTSVSEGESYLVTANDIGKRIRAARRTHVTEPTGPIEMKSVIIPYVKAVVRVKQLKFAAETSRGGLTWSAVVDDVGIVLKTKGAPDKAGKWSTIRCSAIPDTQDEMILFLNPSAKFVIRPNLSGDPKLAKAIGANVRDFIVIVITRLSRAGKT
jgi:hypothetical protein